MSKSSGKTVSISPYRHLVIDLLHFGAQVPAVTLERRMNLAPLMAARHACSPRPMWSSIFIKAYSIVAAKRPVLRRCYMKSPWARFYEHPNNVANINISRKVGDEDVVLQGLICSPERHSLAELDVIVRGYVETPVEELNCYRRARRLSAMPWPIRRFVMWAALNCIGRHRCDNFGTFGISSVAENGAGILNVILVATSMVHYGLMDDNGCLDVRLAFDHRVLDGAPAAEALASVEATLLGEILDELKSLARDPPA